MKTEIALILVITQLSACAFKDTPAVTEDKPIEKTEKTRFIPKDLQITEGNQTLALIDTVDVPSGDYQIDQTLPVKGTVEYVYKYPQFHETDCSGLGYTISYDEKRRGINSSLRLKVYVNGNVNPLDHIVVSPQDKVQLAVYADYPSLSEFLDKGVLPNEFVKSFEPSASCHQMCPQIRVAPLRPLISPPGKRDCHYVLWGTGADGYATATRTSDFYFEIEWFDQKDTRESYLQQIQDCDAVRNNQDLEAYYKAATNNECSNGTHKYMFREWYFVEQKIPYASPVYTISNFTKIVQNTSETQTEYLKDMLVHVTSDWSN